MSRDELAITDTVATAVGRGSAVGESLSIRGHVRAELTHPDGTVEISETDNLIVTAGKEHIADQLSSTPGQAAMSHMSVGTGTTAPAVGQTALVTEVDRNALTSRTRAGNVVTYVGDWAAGDATANLQEAGIHNAAAAGTMLARALINVNKAAGDTLKITWTVTIG